MVSSGSIFVLSINFDLILKPLAVYFIADDSLLEIGSENSETSIQKLVAGLNKTDLNDPSKPEQDDANSIAAVGSCAAEERSVEAHVLDVAEKKNPDGPKDSPLPAGDSSALSDEENVYAEAKVKAIRTEDMHFSFDKKLVIINHFGRSSLHRWQKSFCGVIMCHTESYIAIHRRD